MKIDISDIKKEEADGDGMKKGGPGTDELWVQNFGIKLTKADREAILKGDKLNDLVIDFAQFLLKKQFNFVSGLQSTLLQLKKQTPQARKQLQILHVRQDHWVVASTLSDESGAIHIYDTVYNDIDENTKVCLANVFGHTTYKTIPIPKQIGAKDCGVYAIAIITALAYGQDPSASRFEQSTMRSHLVLCFDHGCLSLFR